MSNNHAAFSKALDSTINYNKSYLLRQKLNKEIEARNPPVEVLMVDVNKPEAQKKTVSGNKRHHFFVSEESTSDSNNEYKGEKRSKKVDSRPKLK